MANALPERSQVVVIGGGAVGCSVAYHLAHGGWTDVVLLERDQPTVAPPSMRPGWWDSCGRRRT